MYRIDILLKENRQLFHTRDLALIWGIENKNTLYTAIKRYVREGILIPIFKGFYATIPLENIDPVLIGISALASFAYISCEYILAINGITFQSTNYFTLISSVSKKFKIDHYQYLVRKLRDVYLYNDIGIYEENGVKKATLERAVADMQYFNPQIHLDNRISINWRIVREIKKEVGYI